MYPQSCSKRLMNLAVEWDVWYSLLYSRVPAWGIHHTRPVTMDSWWPEITPGLCPLYQWTCSKLAKRAMKLALKETMRTSQSAWRWPGPSLYSLLLVTDRQILPLQPRSCLYLSSVALSQWDVGTKLQFSQPVSILPFWQTGMKNLKLKPFLCWWIDRNVGSNQYWLTWARNRW